ncbi:MAG: CRTAC1 family protein [Sneathiella sp.]|nr:CRTAC1 family protein [Sneathiella sp.]
MIENFKYSVSLKLLLFIIFNLLTYNVNAETPNFINRTAELKINHIYTGGWEHFVGGGIAAFDCNKDGYPEIYLSGGSSKDQLFLNNSASGDASISFKLIETMNETGTVGVYPLDIDSDGWLDLFLLKVGENKILKGGPNCTFNEANNYFGYKDQQMWSTAFSATWEPGQTLPTLAVGNYVDRDHKDAPFGTCENNHLYRPQDSTYVMPHTLSPGFCSLSMLFSDWGRTGRRDLRISNDRHYYVKGGSEQLWRMQGKPKLYSKIDGWNNHSIWGMGIASRDITGDGISEVYLTSMGDQKLQFLGPNGQPNFKNARFEVGVTAQRPYVGGDGRPSTGWHAEFGDMDNNGRDDLFVTKGNVDQMPDAAMSDPNNLLMGQSNGRFKEFGLEAGIASFHRARGAAVVDLNLDGRLDIVVVNRRANVEILENTSKDTGSFLSLQIVQKQKNINAVGAWIEVKAGERVWHREITVGGGHASGQAGFHHFGVGKAIKAQIRVIWPTGEESSWSEVGVNQHLKVEKSGTELLVTYLKF